MRGKGFSGKCFAGKGFAGRAGNPLLHYSGNTLGKKTLKRRQCLVSLRNLLANALMNSPRCLNAAMEGEKSDPSLSPLVWISKWIDYSDKYGFGYQLCNEGVGVMFNDRTKLIMLPNGEDIQYVNTVGLKTCYTKENFPPTLKTKVKLLFYFRKYMDKRLQKAGGSNSPQEHCQLSCVPYVYAWCRSEFALIMHLTNGTVQVNFCDHTKIIVCPWMEAVTYLDRDRNIRTFKFTSLRETGCSPALSKRLQFAYGSICKMLVSYRPQVRL